MIKGKPYKKRLQSLHLLSLKFRRTLFDVVFLYKCLNGLLGIDLSGFLDFRDAAPYNLRNADLSFKTRYAGTNTLKFSFFPRTVRAWNSLPTHIRKSDSLPEFKRLCKAHLCQLDP